MGQNLYEAIMTRNGVLAKFFDENHNAAAMVKKVIGMVVRINDEQMHVDASKIAFSVYSPKGSDVIVIRLAKT